MIKKLICWLFGHVEDFSWSEFLMSGKIVHRNKNKCLRCGAKLGD